MSIFGGVEHLRGLAILKAAFVALCREAFHQARRVAGSRLGIWSVSVNALIASWRWRDNLLVLALRNGLPLPTARSMWVRNVAFCWSGRVR
jgi:hypothetical protein